MYKVNIARDQKISEEDLELDVINQLKNIES